MTILPRREISMQVGVFGEPQCVRVPICRNMKQRLFEPSTFSSKSLPSRGRIANWVVITPTKLAKLHEAECSDDDRLYLAEHMRWTCGKLMFTWVRTQAIFIPSMPYDQVKLHRLQLIHLNTPSFACLDRSSPPLSSSFPPSFSSPHNIYPSACIHSLQPLF